MSKPTSRGFEPKGLIHENPLQCHLSPPAVEGWYPHLVRTAAEYAKEAKGFYSLLAAGTKETTYGQP